MKLSDQGGFVLELLHFTNKNVHKEWVGDLATTGLTHIALNVLDLEKKVDLLITDNKYWKEEYDLAELSISRKKNTIKDLQKKIDKLEKLKSCEAIAKLRTTLVKEIDYCLGR